MRRRPEGGFTLIELMVVVLILAILVAIALPTFFGARARANDRAAQSRVRNAFVVEMIVYADKATFTNSPVILDETDASLTYVIPVAPPIVVGGNTVHIQVSTTSTPDDTVLLAGRSATGRCFWLRVVGGMAIPRFATNDCLVVPPLVDFVDSWD
ncbi:MAG: type IV pilin protein [Acidimicrobiales bacterium]